jgi:hypothetical protein
MEGRPELGSHKPSRRQDIVLIRYSLILSSVFLAISCRPASSPPGASSLQQDTLSVKLGKVPELGLSPAPPVSRAQARRIRELIASLAALDKPCLGLSATQTGSGFAPLPGQSQTGALLLSNEVHQPSESLKDLVTLGPCALPYLLDALDDETPTKLIFENRGNMWHSSELHINPVNPAERVAARPRVVNPPRQNEYVNAYTVKIGDVCFVAIGQIVGRPYQAVRYQPSECVVLNCPTHNPELCAAVRSIWSAKDPRRMLFDSLLTDYVTEGVFNGKSLDGWNSGSEFQCEAALRLLFYFDRDASQLVASRLENLEVGKDQNLDSFIRRCVANRVRTVDFVKAVAWCKAPDVRSSLVELFKRAGDIDTMLSALPAVEDNELVRGRLEPMIASLPAEEEGLSGNGYYLLVAFYQRAPHLARAVFDRYFRNASTQRCQTLCLVLREVNPDWDVDLLCPLLTDTRRGLGTYAVSPWGDASRQPIRVCDEAAVTLSKNHPGITFTQVGDYADLDKQIAAIRKAVAGEE